MANTPELRRVIRAWLAEHDKTQAWLAHQLGIHDSQLSRVMAGYQALSDELSARIQKKTGLDLSEFVTKSAVA